TKPPDQKFPPLVGMNIQDARSVADRANVRLMEHEEFNEKTQPGIVFRCDWQPGRPIRPGRSVNIWVSKGSKMVWVPKLSNLTTDEAEKKLKSGGLVLGEVDRQYSESIPYGSVVSQNPRAGKRVNRDIPVSLVVSDGQKPRPDDIAQGTPPDSGNANPAASEGGAVPSVTPDTGGDTAESDLEP